ncbi:hypothetical protein [Parasitella parasitica]|uniref:Uncharacterized protein n=1 Tax=Parasitella parasitica TaxID=35722 RepID=A0A0B7N0T7_9FUNG|nr:hypothetical protein [Parasitella parasitica]
MCLPMSAAAKYFPGEESYYSVFHFLRIFEKVVSSSGNDVETVWKCYLPLTIPCEYDLWLKEAVSTTQQVAYCTINILSTIKCPLTIVSRASAVAAAAPNVKSGSGSGGRKKSFGWYKKILLEVPCLRMREKGTAGPFLLGVDHFAQITVLSGLLDTSAPVITHLEKQNACSVCQGKQREKGQQQEEEKP